MKIYFGYIEGISRIDTPYFAAISEQEDYFDSHEVVTIDNTFYPPHYTNVIKVDSEDIEFNTTVNYVWLEYLNKRYYYFIDDIEYVSETIANIYITMDTIQTYMFNIKVTNGIIERKFIDRWKRPLPNTYTINRAYIRENVSNNLFDVVERTIYNSEYRKWMYIMKTTKLIDAASGPFVDTMGDCSTTVGVIDNGDLKYSIEIPNALYFSYPVQYSGTNLVKNNIPTVGVTFPETCDAFIIPFETINSVYIDNNNVINRGSGAQKDYGHTSYWFIFEPAWTYISKIHSEQVTFNIVVNTAIYKVFDSKYIPQLLDENYINFKFGDNAYYTEYPLHQLNNFIVYCKYWADNSTGCRYYNITDSSTVALDNKYNTIVKNPSPLILDLKNKPWEEYLARNKNGLMSAMVNDIGSYSSSVGRMNMSTNSYLNKLEDIGNDSSMWDKRFKTPHLKEKGRRLLNASKERYDNDILSSTYDAMGTKSSTLNYFINRDNLVHAPSSIKQSGDASNDLCSDNGLVSFRLSLCNDYSQCAHYFHRNGVLVNEYINSRDNIFDYVNTRYYFNVLKMNDVDLHLVGIIEDESSVQLVKDRLSGGLRLWNKVAKLIETPYLATYSDDESTRTVAIPYVGTYLEDNIEIENLSGNHYIASKTAANGIITIVIYRNAPGAYRLHGIIKSYDTTQQDINIGNFEYDNVEKSYLS